MKNYLKMLNPFSNISMDGKVLFFVKNVLKYLTMYALGLILAEAVVLMVHYILGYNPLQGNFMDFDTMILFKYYGYIVVIFTVIIFVEKTDKNTIKDLGFTKNIIDVFKGVFLAGISLFIIVTVLVLLKQVSFIGINKNADIKLMCLFFGGFLIQSTAEEILCRGFLFQRLNEKFSINLSILFSFMAFGIPHFPELFKENILIGIVGIFNLLLVTYVFSFLMIRYKNIYPSIGFHSIWNFILFSIIGLNLSGTDNYYSLLSFSTKNNFINGGNYGIEASIICTIILLLITIVLKQKINKQYKI